MELRGIPVCSGRVCEQSYLLAAVPEFDSMATSTQSREERGEIVREALAQIMAETEEARARYEAQHEQENAALMEVQMVMLEDGVFLDGIEEKLDEGFAPHAAVLQSGMALEEMLRNIGDEYMAARAEDTHDLTFRLACKICGLPYPDLSGLHQPRIVVAGELLPSMLLSADLSCVKGLVLATGTKTSHVSILASGLQIPAIVGCGDVSAIADGEQIYVDADAGTVCFQMSEAERSTCLHAVEEYQKTLQRLKTFTDKPFQSSDGIESRLMVNITDPVELDHLGECKIAGVGLLRSEFLYMERNALPPEEEQYLVYARAAKQMGERTLTIRTLDIGGDKDARCLMLEKEANPFMGYRAIRICLDRPELILTQLRAILRAACHGSIQIMFPMVALPEELVRMRGFVEQAAQQLQQEGVAFRKDVPIGMMVEVPSAVIMLDQLLPLVDFVSIGSNDLVQYTFAADRLNTKLGYLNNFLHPAALRLIKHTIDMADKYGKQCSLCGEMAGDPMGMAVLAMLGLKKFSVGPSKLLRCKEKMSLLDVGAMRKQQYDLLNSQSAQRVEEYMRDILPAEYFLA